MRLSLIIFVLTALSAQNIEQRIVYTPVTLGLASDADLNVWVMLLLAVNSVLAIVAVVLSGCLLVRGKRLRSKVRELGGRSIEKRGDKKRRGK